MINQPKQIVMASFTWAIPGYWIQFKNGEKEFSPFGVELTDKQKAKVHEFPVGTFKAIN